MSIVCFRGIEEKFIKEWNGSRKELQELIRNNHFDLKHLLNKPDGTWLLRHSSYNKVFDIDKKYELVLSNNSINIERFLAVSFKEQSDVKHILLLKNKDGTYASGIAMWHDKQLIINVTKIYNNIQEFLVYKRLDIAKQFKTNMISDHDSYFRTEGYDINE